MLPAKDLAELTIAGQAPSQYTPASRRPQPARLHMHHDMRPKQSSRESWEPSHSFLPPGESSGSSTLPLATQWATSISAQQAHEGSATSVSLLRPSSRTLATKPPSSKTLTEDVRTRTKRVRDLQRDNPERIQKEIAKPSKCSKTTIRRHLSSLDDLVGQDQSSVSADRPLRPRAPKIPGGLKGEGSCLNFADASPQKLAELSYNVVTSPEAAHDAIDTVLRYCRQQPPGYLDLEDAVNLGRLKEKLRAHARRD